MTAIFVVPSEADGLELIVAVQENLDPQVAKPFDIGFFITNAALFGAKYLAKTYQTGFSQILILIQQAFPGVVHLNIILNVLGKCVAGITSHSLFGTLCNCAMFFGLLLKTSKTYEVLSVILSQENRARIASYLKIAIDRLCSEETANFIERCEGWHFAF